MSSEMNINRENYGSYFLDYLEGKLDRELLPQLRSFLEKNPDLAVELEGLDEIILHAGPVTDPVAKDDLKKKIQPVAGIDEGNIDEMLVASLEGDLGSEEEVHLQSFLQKNPAYHYDEKLFKATLLHPEEDIIYPDKEKLKRRRAGIIPFVRTAVAVAAALLILLLGWKVFFEPGNPVPDEEMNAFVQTKEGETRPVPLKMGSIQAGENLAVASPKILSTGPKPVPEIGRSIPITLAPKTLVTLETQREMPLVINRYYHRDVLASLQPEMEEENAPGLIARVFRNFGQRARESGEVIQDVAGNRDRNINFWDIADLGLQGYNKLTDREVELVVVKDKTGSTTEYSFTEDGRILLSSPQGRQ